MIHRHAGHHHPVMVLLPRVGQGFYGGNFASIKTSMGICNPGQHLIPSAPYVSPAISPASPRVSIPVAHVEVVEVVGVRPYPLTVRERQADRGSPRSDRPRTRGMWTRKRTEEEEKERKKVFGPSPGEGHCSPGRPQVSRSMGFKLGAIPKHVLGSHGSHLPSHQLT